MGFKELIFMLILWFSTLMVFEYIDNSILKSIEVAAIEEFSVDEVAIFEEAREYEVFVNNQLYEVRFDKNDDIYFIEKKQAVN